MLQKFKDLGLSKKFLIVIGLILFVLANIDFYFLITNAKSRSVENVRKLAKTQAETVRLNLNNLMIEGKMKSRWWVYDKMKEEIKGVKNIRVIRDKKVNDIFLKMNEERDIPEEMEAITEARIEIEKFKSELKDTQDEEEIQIIKEEIDDLKVEISKSKEAINKLKNIPFDERAKPQNDDDLKVLKTGEPIFRVVGDTGRTIIPYKSQKWCSGGKSLTGCHQFAKEGDVLGAVSMDISMQEANEQLQSDIISSFILQFGRIVILLFIIYLLLSRLIIGSIKEVSGSIENISDGGGDLTKRLEVKSQDEIGELSHKFNTFVEKIHDIISKLTETTIRVNTSAKKLSGSVSEQASVAAQQSASVSEITSTVEEISATSNLIADNSSSVVEIASKTLESTENGAGEIKAVGGKMNEIYKDNQTSIQEILALGKKSKEITKVMEIINSIADQTKLIAFNAAIEASSAGEAGKRFGVVAVEIRRLADNVMESTGEIERKINEIHEAVSRLVVASENGSKSVRDGLESSSQTVAMLEEILEDAQATTDAAKQISLSSQQQKTANNQVVIALKEIEEGAGQTSDSINEIDSISKNLSKLSDELKNMVGEFKLKEQPLV